MNAPLVDEPGRSAMLARKVVFRRANYDRSMVPRALGLALLWLAALGCEGLLKLDGKTFDLGAGGAGGGAGSVGAGGQGGDLGCNNGVVADDFNAIAADLWTYEPGIGVINFDGGVLNLRSVSTSPTTIFVHSLLPVDARGKQLSVYVPKVPDPTHIDFADLLLTPAGDLSNMITIIAINGTTRLSIILDGDDQGVTVDDDRRYWRIVDAGDQVHLQLSSDGQDYESIVSRALGPSFSLSSVNIFLRLVGAGQGHAEHVQFDQLTSTICRP